MQEVFCIVQEATALLFIWEWIFWNKKYIFEN